MCNLHMITGSSFEFKSKVSIVPKSSTLGVLVMRYLCQINHVSVSVRDRARGGI